jgi:phosphoglycolate phosphatase
VTANPPPPVKSIKVIAFDCDGVMFDTRKANQAYYNHLLTRFGRPPLSPEQFAYVHMHTVDRSLAFLFKEPSLLEAARAYRQGMSYDPFLRYLEIEPYLKPLLRALRPRYKTAIATNRSDTMHPLLEAHGLEPLFDLVVRSVDVTRPKPHPEALFRVMDHFGIAPEEALYIGDSRVDEEAAAAAKIPLVAYRNPKLKAAFHIDRLRELEGLLDGGENKRQG